jgi:hypothetical protein
MGSGKRFAEALDLSVFVLIVAAYAVAVSGGFRWEPFGLRLSMTSPSRAVLLAGLLVLVRRWRAPGVPLHRWLAGPLARLRQPSIPDTESSILNSQFSILNSPSPLRTWRGEWVWVSALFLALTALMTWQQLASPYAVGDTGDPLFSIWRLSWVAHQLPRDPLRLFDANIFYPELRTLAYSDAMLATALLAAPLLWLGVHQVLVYNIVLLLSFAASGVTMYALARALTGDRAAAFVAGVAFAFYPFRFEHYSHLELQVTFWMPLALLMMHRTMRTGRARDGAVTGLLVALQTLSSLYCGLFLLVVMAVVWLATGGLRPALRRPAPWLVAAAVLVVLVLPIVVPYLQNRGQLGERPDWEARIYSATPRSYVVAHVRSRFYGGLLDGPRTPEASLFPGLAVVALALAGAWPRLTRGRAAYALAALVAFDGSLGLNGIVFPTLRDALLPFRGLRVPARFSILVGLSLSVLAGYGVQRLRHSPWLKGGRLGTVLPVACAAVLLVENVPNLQLTEVPARPPLIYDYFKGAPTSVLVDLPFPESLERATADSRRLYYSTFHWQTLITGSSGYFPESFRQAVRMLKGVPTARAVTFLQERGVQFIALNRADCADWEYWQSIEYLDQEPRVELVRRISGSRHDASLYRLPPRSTTPPAPVPAGGR